MRTVAQQKQYRKSRPGKAAEYQRRYVQQHPDRIKATAQKVRAKWAALIEKAKCHPCADCGVIYPPFVMDFDHRDPTTKLFEIGLRGHGYQAMIDEIAKCDVVCANCHRLRTFTVSWRPTIPKNKVPS